MPAHELRPDLTVDSAPWIRPQWPAPSGVKACSTTRQGGFSSGAYTSLNLGDHVGDDPALVRSNRARLREQLALPAEPAWLEQVHGCRVVDAANCAGDPRADASYAHRPGAVCVVLTADCLPVLLCNRAGTRVGVIHAGWRGIAAGVIEAAVNAMGGDTRELLAWLGPAIGPGAFEVGPEVRDALFARSGAPKTAFSPAGEERYLADLYAIARWRLRQAGVEALYGGGWCTKTQVDQFFSHRRDQRTGRMATLIWLDTGDGSGRAGR